MYNEKVFSIFTELSNQSQSIFISLLKQTISASCHSPILSKTPTPGNR